MSRLQVTCRVHVTSVYAQYRARVLESRHVTDSSWNQFHQESAVPSRATVLYISSGSSQLIVRVPDGGALSKAPLRLRILCTYLYLHYIVLGTIIYDMFNKYINIDWTSLKRTSHCITSLLLRSYHYITSKHSRVYLNYK